MNHNHIVNFDDVTFSYNKELALKGVSFSLKKGDYFAILGPNGSGKTTLLKIMLGIIFPNKGSIFLQGKKTREVKNFSFIGYVPQHVSQTKFQFPVSVREVVFSGRTPKSKIFSRFKKEDKLAVDKAMEVTGIKNYQEKKMDELSGGQKQKVFIARALAGEPLILVLDEPFAGVDSSSKADFYNLLQKLNRELKVTILLTSHDIDEVSKEAKNILFLNQSVIYCGPSESFDKKLVERFIHRHIIHD